MKTLTTIFVFLFVCSEPSSQWIIQEFESICYSSSFLDINTGYVVHLNGVKKTTDSGNNWISMSSGLSGLQRDLFFINQLTGFTVSYETQGNIGGIFKTTNGGNSWTHTPDNRLYSIFFSNLNTGYAGGKGGRLLKTTNNGINWVSISSGINNDIMAIHFVNDNTGFLAYRDSLTTGAGGISKTVNGASSWNNFSLPGRMNCLFAVDENIIYSTCYFTVNDTIRGRVYKTTNQGMNWNITFDLNTYGFNTVYFTDINTGYLGGSKNNVGAVIYKTTNAGSNWQEQWFDATTSTIYNIEFENQNTGWAVGYFGIRKTTNGGGFVGISTENESLPLMHSLFQNYPNPFNPETNIKFSLHKPDYVSLTIYNALGELVIVIFDRLMNKGTHNFRYNAAGLASGIYYYRLKAGNFTDIKKMVLIK